ncbi:MAG: hypothetical protein ACON4R_01900 [Akkermansiaceae bacterium]
MTCWNAPKIAVLGGGAHTLSPHLGRGVNLAVVDAAVLASCFGQLPPDLALVEFT